MYLLEFFIQSCSPQGVAEPCLTGRTTTLAYNIIKKILRNVIHMQSGLLFLRVPADVAHHWPWQHLLWKICSHQPREDVAEQAKENITPSPFKCKCKWGSHHQECNYIGDDFFDITSATPPQRNNSNCVHLTLRPRKPPLIET